jgi:hypothetical protein
VNIWCDHQEVPLHRTADQVEHLVQNESSEAQDWQKWIIRKWFKWNICVGSSGSRFKWCKWIIWIKGKWITGGKQVQVEHLQNGSSGSAGSSGTSGANDHLIMVQMDHQEVQVQRWKWIIRRQWNIQ